MVRLCTCVLLASVSFAPITSAQSPQSAPVLRDATAVVCINQALAVLGGVTAIAAIQDFTGNGQITYYWGGQEATGNVVVRGHSTDEFRLDANLASGTRSWAVSKGTGSRKEADGKTTPIPFHNAIRFGSLTFPLPRLNQLITDTAIEITDQGLVTVSNQHFRKIHVRRDLFEKDPDGSANRLQDADLFFDPQSLLLLGIQDETHPVNTMTMDVPHSLYFSDYRQVNGLLVPFNITEYMGGQRTWSMQLTEIKFNTGLIDADFQL